MTVAAPNHTSDTQQKRIIAVALLLLVVISAPVFLWFNGSRSSAAFADSEVLEANRLGAGTLDLAIGQKTMTFEAANLAPGDTVSGQLELVNAGTLPILLDLSGTSDGDLLADWLRFDVWTSQSTCGPNDVQPRIASNLRLTSQSTTIFAPTTTSPASSNRLAVGESAVFCLGAQLLLEAPNDAQGRRTEIDLLVNAVHDIEAEQ